MIKCPRCKEPIEDRSNFCNMCGFSIEEARKNGTIPVVDRIIETQHGPKSLQLYCKDILDFEEPIDILTVSAFSHSYRAYENTLIGALDKNMSVSVEKLAESPFVDLRDSAGCWISKPLEEASGKPHIGRIGCIETLPNQDLDSESDKNHFTEITSFFCMLDLLSNLGVEMGTVAVPLLGTGNQGVLASLAAIPLVNEILSSLERNLSVNRIIIAEKSWDKVCVIAEVLNSSLSLNNKSNKKAEKRNEEESPFVFISYTNDGDRETAEMLMESLNRRGIEVWFAPNDIIVGDYASAIVDGINRCTHFICVISENSMKSPHVLNEVDLAFQHIRDGVNILPFRMDSGDLSPSFMYYLSRMEWYLGYPAPTKSRIEDFINKVFGL